MGKTCDTCMRLNRASKPGNLDMCTFFDVRLHVKFQDPDNPCIAWGIDAFIDPKINEKIDETSWLLVTIDDFHNTKDPEKKERLRSEIAMKFGFKL